MKVPNFSTALLLLFPIILSGCAGNTNPVLETVGVTPVTLNQAQIKVVEAGLGEMAGGSLASGQRGMRALTFADKPGIHVCGVFDHQGKETRFYIELRNKDGAPYAERGQIGTDASKISKIAFVCRHHG